LASAIREQSLIENILSAEKPSRDRLAKWYTDSVNALRKLQDEWQEFVRGMIQVEEAHRGRISEDSKQAHASNRNSWLRLITEDSSLCPIPLPSRLSSELLSGEEDHFKAFAEKDILSKVNELHATILDQLRRLVELEVCGLIARYSVVLCLPPSLVRWIGIIS
jgi:hypothetical protein